MSAIPRFVLIDRVPPVSDFGRLRFSHLVWRGLLPLGEVLPITVGAPPPRRWRSTLRRLGARYVPARTEGLSGRLEIGSIERRARWIGHLAAAGTRPPDAIIFADPELFELYATRDFGQARRVLLVDHWPDGAEAPDEFLRVAAAADEIWVIDGAAADRLRRRGRRKMGVKGAVPADKIVIIAPAVDVSPPSSCPASGLIVLPVESGEDAAPLAAAAAETIRHLEAAGHFPVLKQVGAGSVDDGFVLGPVLDELERGAAILVPGDACRFRPLLLAALASGRPVIGTPAAFDGIAVKPGKDVLIGADSSSLAAAVQSVLADRTLADRLGSSARRAISTRHAIEDAIAAVARAVARLGVEAPAESMVGLNLRPETRDLEIFFNRQSRLLSFGGFVRAGVPNQALSASFRAAGTPDLPNAWVTIGAQDDDWAYFSADAVLPPEVAPGQLEMQMEAFGLPFLSLPVETEPSPEVAGFIALELEGSGLAVDIWSLDPDVKIQVGTRVARLEAVGPAERIGATDAPEADEPHSERPEGSAGAVPLVGAAAEAVGELPASAGPHDAKRAVRWRGIGRWPLDRKSVKAISSFGRGQNFSAIEKWLGPDTPSSAQLSRWKDRHAGKTAWLIGNGPSVRTEDLDRLGSAITFSFNRFYLSHEMTSLRPTYTVSGDKQMIEDFGQEIIDRSGGTVFLAHDQVPDVVGDYIWLRQLSVSPPLFSLNPDRVVAPGGSSLFVALQVAYYMGIRRFYFYGADFRFVFKAHKSSRDAYRAASGDGNHFIKNYRDGRPWCPPSFRQIASAFFAARALVESENGFIRNATRGGALEVFPRCDFEDALSDS